jgi:hypothetical protein
MPTNSAGAITILHQLQTLKTINHIRRRLETKEQSAPTIEAKHHGQLVTNVNSRITLHTTAPRNPTTQEAEGAEIIPTQRNAPALAVPPVRTAKRHGCTRAEAIKEAKQVIKLTN